MANGSWDDRLLHEHELVPFEHLKPSGLRDNARLPMMRLDSSEVRRPIALPLPLRLSRPLGLF